MVTERQILFEELIPTHVQTLCFVASWLLTGHYVKNHGRFRSAQTISKAHSWIYAAGSAALLYYIATYPPASADFGRDASARFKFHDAKLYEYVGLVAARAAGGNSVIPSALFFYHLTMPYLSFFRVVRTINGWRTFAALNATHNVVSYASSATGGAVIPQALLDLTGFLQLAGGIANEARVLMLRQGDIWTHVFTAGLLGTYLVLWAKEIGMRHEDQVLGKPRAKRIRYWGLASDI